MIIIIIATISLISRQTRKTEMEEHIINMKF